MSGIEVWGWENGRPYAHVINHNEFNYKAIYLGVKEFAGMRLPPRFGVDLDIARAEAVPIQVHNAVELFWQGNHPLTIEIGALGLLTNIVNLPALRHEHDEEFGEFVGLLKDMQMLPSADRDASLNQLARRGIEQLSDNLFKNVAQYGGVAAVDNYIKNLDLFDKMLVDPVPDPRNYRVASDGRLQTIV